MSKKAEGLGGHNPSVEFEKSHKDLRRMEAKSRLSEVSDDVRPPVVEFAGKFDFSHKRSMFLGECTYGYLLGLRDTCIDLWSY